MPIVYGMGLGTCNTAIICPLFMAWVGSGYERMPWVVFQSHHMGSFINACYFPGGVAPEFLALPP